MDLPLILCRWRAFFPSYKAHVSLKTLAYGASCSQGWQQPGLSLRSWPAAALPREQHPGCWASSPPDGSPPKGGVVWSKMAISCTKLMVSCRTSLFAGFGFLWAGIVQLFCNKGAGAGAHCCSRKDATGRLQLPAVKESPDLGSYSHSAHSSGHGSSLIL